MSEPTEATKSGLVDRRTVVKAAAWSIPVVTVMSASPAMAASGDNGQISVNGGPWIDSRDSDGYIAEGIVFTLRDSGGNPVANRQVTFLMDPTNGPFYITQDLTYDENTAEAQRPSSSQSRTLTTDSNGRIQLNGADGDNGSQWGWIRKGQYSSDTDQSTLMVKDDATGEILASAVLKLGGSDPGIKPGR